MPLLETLQFDEISPESIKAETKAKISSSLLDTGLQVDMREGSYTDILISEAAYQIYKACMLAQDILSAAVPGPDGGIYLDKFAAAYGLTRTAGAKASVVITFSGTNGTIIPSGTWVVSTGGYRYQTRAPVTITAGTAQVIADAEAVGACYNVDAGDICRLQTAVSGVTGVTNAPAVGGVDVESDTSFYTRIRSYLSKPRTSGNVYDYEAWARECAGIGYVKVVPLWDGPGTVKVIVAGDDKLPVAEAVRAAVAAHIEDVRTIGADVTVTSVESVTIDIALTCILDEQTLPEDVETAFLRDVQALLADFDVGAGEVLRYNRILALALSAAGVEDCTALTVNGGTDNIAFSPEQVPKLGTVTLTVG